MGEQITLPGTETVIGSFNCGHGRTHQIPSEAVTVFMEGSGFSATCTCGHGPVKTGEVPHLGPHTVLLGGTNLDPDTWLALDAEADDWFPNTDPDLEPINDGQTPREKRQAYRKQMREEYDG